jgi:hypothetical protein
VPLFDPANARSEEVLVALRVADLIAATTEWQQLTELNENDSRQKIFVGTDPSPVDGIQYTVDELAGLFCTATIHRTDGTHIVVGTGIVGDRPDEQGELTIKLRRYVRESEDERDAYLFFWDRVSAMVAELQDAVDNAAAPRVKAIHEPLGPFLGDEKAEGAQGKYCWSTITVAWGDPADQ